MMHANSFSGTIDGVRGLLVRVEVHTVRASLQAFRTVGLPSTEVRESRERVRAAIENSHFAFPQCRITVNLAPADVKKQGAAFDLSVALGILACLSQVPGPRISQTLLLGELALDGSLRPVRGALPVTLAASRSGLKRCLVPVGNLAEASLVEGIGVYPVRSLQEAVELLRSDELPPPAEHRVPEAGAACSTDFRDIKGQHQAKRAIEIAAAGGHNLLMSGPPGAGKTMIAKGVVGILPPLSKPEAIEVASIHSSSGSAIETLPRMPPFRAPHHSISYAAMAGGGSFVRPGEVSLAHRGILFLDELAEFPRRVLEVLRQPLEEGAIAIHRVQHRLTLPARFMLVAATNPCPCGYRHSEDRTCRCMTREVHRYQAKLSGPLLDRMDLLVRLRALSPNEILERPNGEPSAAICRRVTQARRRQRLRFESRRSIAGTERAVLNGSMSSSLTETLCAPNSNSMKLLRESIGARHISARGYHRLLRVARTIADLDGTEQVEAAHLEEAIQFRFAAQEQ